MIELTELIFRAAEATEEPILINPRHIVSARPSRCEPYKSYEDKVYRITLVTGEVVFCINGSIGNDPEEWARALGEAA